MMHFTRGLVLSGLLCSVAWAADETVKAGKPADAAATENAPTDKARTAAMDKTVQELAAHVKKSVVVVTFRGRDGERQGLGAGFIIDPSGLIATNMHVIGEARPISVELHDGRKFDVTAIQATERSQDLAILKIDARELPALPLGNSDELQEGQPIVAIGNPIGLERSVVAGVLSGRRDIEGRAMLQIALPIERGNSGGPLLDMQGRVHGLLTLKSLKTENLGFAIPINALKPLLEKPNPIPMSRWLTIGVLDPEEWTVLPGGRWRQRSGRLFVSGPGGGFGGRALCLSTQAAPAVPYEVAVQVKYEPNDGAAGLVFHADGGDRHYGFYPSSGGVRLSRFDGPDVYAWKVLREIRSPHLNKTGWNELKVRVEKDRMLCYLNDELVIEAADTEYKSGRIGLCKFRQTEAEFKGFRFGETIASINKPSTELADRVTRVVGELSSTATPASATDHLLAEGPASVKLLEQQAAKLEQQAGRVRQLAAGLQLKQTLAELEKLLSVKDDDKVDLLRAGLLISKLDNPELDIDSYVQEVERHARRAQVDLPKEATDQDRLAALNRYLFEEQGFHGSRTDYDNRSNSYLNEVLDDREGLPISLSVIYIEVARRMGLNVVGVGMPRHFMARYEPKEGGTQLIDVFERGKLLSKDEAKAKFESLSDEPWRESHLDTSPPRAILERMLRNLFNTAASAEDAERMLRYLEAVLLLKPDSARDRFFRAVVCYQTQRWAQARADVEWLQSHDSELSQQAIEDLARALERESPK
ncbi:MAG: tetratricopeptide repeat protein [Candidatus Saccharimonas sp.]|nr:tetratricopeptide repeat protein [Planctomycetaceae bacterium]